MALRLQFCNAKSVYREQIKDNEAKAFQKRLRASFVSDLKYEVFIKKLGPTLSKKAWLDLQF